KTYLYRIDRNRAFNPFIHLYALQYFLPLKIDLLQRCAAIIEGEHDFSAFQAAGTDLITTRRTIYSVEILEIPQETFSGSSLLYVRIRASGFLRKMMRFLVGTMLEIAAGKRPFE